MPCVLATCIVLWVAGVGKAIAIKPGKITMKGNNIFGTAAISGVRRAEFMESAAMARCTTRKSVHQ